MQPDLTQARQFLSLFGPLDEPFTFQGVYDPPKAEDDKKKPAPIFQMTLDEAAPLLAKGNAEGWGIFFAVNALDLPVGQHWKGRRGVNVYKIRAVFVDDDKGTLTADDPRFEGAPPSIIVRSKHGCHFYWLLTPGEDLAKFTPMQRTLAQHFGTDMQVQDLPRVLRVPGFWHMKDPQDPFLVTLLRAEERRYTIHGLREALGIRFLDETEKPQPKPRTVKQGPVTEDEARARARGYVMKMFAIEGDHGDVTTFKVACVLRRDFNLTDSDAWDLFQQWNQSNAQPPWSDRDLRAKFDGAESYGTHSRGEKLQEESALDSLLRPKHRWVGDAHYGTKIVGDDGDVY